jgi:Uncharacterized conserved protein
MSNSAIALDRKKESAHAVKFFDVNKGDEIVVGHQGVRVVPVQRSTTRTDIFQFINTIVDADEPKSAIIRELGEELRRAHTAKVKSRLSPALQLYEPAQATIWSASLKRVMSIAFSPEIHLPRTMWNALCTEPRWE